MIFGLLLAGGAVLTAAPVVIHLLLRQQPKRLPFPAFRFLRQRARTNQRKLRLRHILLLLLRMLLVALMCLALARLEFRFTGALSALAGDAPVAAVLVVDTSASMDLSVAGKTRLDEAKQRAGELLDALKDGGKLAVLDTADPADAWEPTALRARERLAGLPVAPANRPVTAALAAAYKLFARLDDDPPPAGEPMPRLLAVFSDRTAASWDAKRAAELLAVRDKLKVPVQVVWVDVGVDKPTDLAVVAAEVPDRPVPANVSAAVRVTVRAVDPDPARAFETEVELKAGGRTERRPVTARAGESPVVEFSLSGLPPGTHQAEASVVTPDGLTRDNVRFATFEVRGPRKVLLLADKPEDARVVSVALEAFGLFPGTVMTPEDAKKLTPPQLAEQFKAVCLVSVGRPEPDLWDRLEKYVRAGGHLLILPGDDAAPDAYAGDAASRLMPARLAEVVRVEDAVGVPWDWPRTDLRQPLLAPFREWSRQPDTENYTDAPRWAYRYWAVKDGVTKTNVVVRYAEKDADGKPLKEGRPALLERAEGRGPRDGRVVLFTTPFDDRPGPDGRRANDYFAGGSSFGFVLLNRVLAYALGDDEPVALNHTVGQTVVVPLPPAPRFPAYTLDGAGRSESVPRPETAGEVRLDGPRTAQPGNYLVFGGKRDWQAAFSLNVPPDEWDLSRLPPDATAPLIPQEAVVTAGGPGLTASLAGRAGTVVEMTPFLVLAVLLALAGEAVLANLFYGRRPDAPEVTKSAG